MNKKKKLFALFPTMALVLSSCTFTIIPDDAPETSEGETSDYTSDTSEGGLTSESTSESGGAGNTSGFTDEDSGSSYLPGASAISYEVKIVSEETTLTQYATKLVEVELYEYEYIEGEASPTLISTTKSSEVSDGVSLTSSSEAVLSIDGLTVSALNSGTAYLSAHWNVNDYIYDSDPVLFTVNEYIPTYTYEAKITSDLTQIEVGSEHLVDVYLYTYADGVIVDSNGVKADASDISLTSGDPSIIETTSGSLTIKALETGTTTLTANWLGHANATDTITIEVISSYEPEPEPEPEPEDVYTYEVKIENKDDYTSVLAGYEHENDEIPALKIGLYTYKNGTQDGNPIYPSSTSEVDGLEVLSSNSSLVSVNSDLTLNINVDSELADPVVISATWNGHYVDESESTIASDSVSVYISYTRYPVYIETIAFTQSEYVLYYGGNEGGDTASVSVTYSPEVVDDDSYSITVENESIATFDPATSTLTAVGVGSTYMTVSATYGGATGTASINVVEGKTDLLSISLSSSTYNLSYSDGYGSFTLGVDQTSDINVTLNPENPDYKQLSVSNSDSYLDINETTTNNFVVSVSDKAKEILKDSAITTDLTISSSYYPEVAAQTLTVIIDQMPAEIAHPVLGILLTGTSVNKTDTGYQSSVLYNGSLTLGTSEKDINVTILPEDAYSTNWSASVDSSDASSSLISLSGDATNGYTITPINGEALTEDMEAQIIISSEGSGSDGYPLTVSLTITIIHEQSYPVSLTITEYESSISLISNSTRDISVSYTVLDQRANPLTGYGISAEVDNSASSTEVSITPTSSTGDFTINAGSIEGEVTISFYLTDYSSIRASQTITVTVTSQYHDISSVSYSGGDQTINVDLGGDVVYGSFTVTDDMVNFSNETNDVNPDDVNQGFSLYTDSTYVSINGHIVTASAYNRGEDLTATIYIYSVANPNATPASFTISIHDNTDYNPTGIVVSQTGSDGINLVEGSYTYFESYYSATLIPSYADGAYIIASTDSKLSVEKDEVGYKISANENAVGMAEESTTASIIVYPTITGDDTYITQAETLDVTITPVLPSTISTYTVNFTFNDDLPSYAKLSIEATLNSETINANLVGSESNYSLTLSDVTPNSTLAYSITIDYDRETYSDAPTSAITTVTSGSVTLSLNGNASTKEAYTEDSLTVTTGASLCNILFDPTPTTKSNITVNFTFTDSDGSGNYRVPTYAKAFIGGYITNGRYSDDSSVSGTWTSPDEASTELTEYGSEGSYYYSYTFSQIYNGDVTFQIYFEYADEVTGSGLHNWNYQWNYDYTVDRYSVSDGDTLNVTINYGNPGDYIEEPATFDPTGKIQFYVVYVDNSGASWSDNYILNVISWGDPVFSGSTIGSVYHTTTSGSGSNTSRLAIYSELAYADPGTSDLWISLQDSYGSQMGMNSAIGFDSYSSDVYVYVTTGCWMSSWFGCGATWSGSATTMYTLSSGQTIEQFINSLGVS
ncbi:MAG: hypothetical protein LUD22_03540 [Coprobacillus sp.]|nr:hypothetical protein [Coprobacillus sp.]